MSNETVNMNQLLQITQNTAMSVNAQAKQMGLILGTVEELKQDVGSIKGELANLKQETTVTRFQANRIQSAIHSRVASLLKLKFDGGKVADESIETDHKYRGGFISRCYTDARRKSKLGTPYYMTLRCDFNEVIEYIESWEPEVSGGKDGYKHYLDIRREEREKRNHK